MLYFNDSRMHSSRPSRYRRWFPFIYLTILDQYDKSYVRSESL